MKSLLLNDILFQIDNYDNEFLIIKSDAENNNFNAIIGEHILKEKYEFIDEVIATNTEILLKLNTKFTDQSLQLLDNKRWELKYQSQLHTLPVCFDIGGDWEAYLKQITLTKEACVNLLLASEYDISMFGFIPGFTYCNGLDERLHCERKSTPNHNLLSKAIAIGGPYLGIYNFPSPAGWHILGQAAVTIFDPGALPPSYFHIGDKFKIEAISILEFNDILKQNLNLIEYNA